MRTTISLSDGLAADVKRKAAEKGVSVSALIESLIRAGLHAEQENVAPATLFRLVTADGRGLVDGVELDRAARLVEADDLYRGLDKVGR